MNNRKSGHLFHYTVYKNNEVLKFIFTLMVFFILLQILSIVFMILAYNAKSVMATMMVPNVAILDWKYLMLKPWTIITYGILHESFWYLLPSVLWLYLFGSVFQREYDGKEIPFLFMIPTVIAGLIYLLVINLLGLSGKFILGTTPGVMSVATATIFLLPRYRVVLGDMISMPLWMLYIVYWILSALLLGWDSINTYIILGMSAILGLGYGVLVSRDFFIGKKINNIWKSINKKFASKELPTNKYGWSTEKLMNQAISVNPSKREEIIQIARKLEQEGVASLSVYEKVLIFGVE